MVMVLFGQCGWSWCGWGWCGFYCVDGDGVYEGGVVHWFVLKEIFLLVG